MEVAQAKFVVLGRFSDLARKLVCCCLGWKYVYRRIINESLVNLKRAIEAFAIPTGDDAREVKRLDSLASLTEQQTRDIRRRNDLQNQLAKIQASAPDRQTILKAIKNLEVLWEHLTMGERSRLLEALGYLR